MNSKTIWLTTILVLLMTACTPTAAPDSPDLDGTNWELTGYGDPDNLTPPVDGSQITLEFTDGQVSGNASCNSYSGSYTLDGSRLTIGELATTLMACLDDDIMAQEAAYTNLLTTAGAFQVDLETVDGLETLTLSSDAGTLVFQKLEALALDHGEWQLSGIAQPETEAVVSTAVDQEITLIFANGQLAGSAGCNRLMASYEVDGDTLTISPVATTKMLCDEERNQREAEFLAALDLVAGFTTTYDSLTLTDADGNMVLSFRPLAA